MIQIISFPKNFPTPHPFGELQRTNKLSLVFYTTSFIKQHNLFIFISWNSLLPTPYKAFQVLNSKFLHIAFSLHKPFPFPWISVFFSPPGKLPFPKEQILLFFKTWATSTYSFSTEYVYISTVTFTTFCDCLSSVSHISAWALLGQRPCLISWCTYNIAPARGTQ